MLGSLTRGLTQGLTRESYAGLARGLARGFGGLARVLGPDPGPGSGKMKAPSLKSSILLIFSCDVCFEIVGSWAVSCAGSYAKVLRRSYDGLTPPKTVRKNVRKTCSRLYLHIVLRGSYAPRTLFAKMQVLSYAGLTCFLLDRHIFCKIQYVRLG